jgi:hypothetical protein
MCLYPGTKPVIVPPLGIFCTSIGTPHSCMRVWRTMENVRKIWVGPRSACYAVWPDELLWSNSAEIRPLSTWSSPLCGFDWMMTLRLLLLIQKSKNARQNLLPRRTWIHVEALLSHFHWQVWSLTCRPIARSSAGLESNPKIIGYDHQCRYAPICVVYRSLVVVYSSINQVL